MDKSVRCFWTIFSLNHTCAGRKSHCKICVRNGDWVKWISKPQSHIATRIPPYKTWEKKKGEKRKEYLTMHFHVDPSWSSCSSMYILTLCSWSSWYQYISPSLSRPIGWRRIASASSSLIIFLNFRLSSNWHSQRYWKNEKVEGILKHKNIKGNNTWKCK